MKLRRLVLIILILLLAFASLAAHAYTSQPHLLEIYPAGGATGIPVTSQVRLKFSRPMEAESVTSRLTFAPPVEGSFSWDHSTLIFTPGQPLPAGQDISLSLSAGARAATWLAFAMPAQNWSFKTSAASLAYLWPAQGPADLYVLDPNSGEIVQYTHAMGILEYSASADGMQIFFSASNTDGGADLFLIDRLAMAGATSYQPRKLLDCGSAQCRNPAVSANGKILAYEYLLPNPQGGLGAAQVWTLDLATQQRLPVGEATHETVQPAWSSTNWLAYYDRTVQAYQAINLANNEALDLPNQTGQPLAWRPDGKYLLAPEIYYHPVTGGSETGTSHLLHYDVQTGNTFDLSGANNVEDVEGFYSPDGKSIAFARKYLDAAQWSFGRQLWVMNADGSNPHPITAEPDYNHYDLAWSRDGHALAYMRFNQAKLSDPPELWMVNADGSNPLQLVIGGYSPLWIP